VFFQVKSYKRPKIKEFEIIQIEEKKWYESEQHEKNLNLIFSKKKETKSKKCHIILYLF